MDQHTSTDGDATPALMFNRRELAGALGDIGVLLPLMAGLIIICGVSAFMVFLLTGLAYVAAGVYFRLPVPVQPLKAMAAIAIVGGASAGEVAAGSIIMGIILLFMSATGLASRLSYLFAPWTVKGVQLAVGLMLIQGSLSFMGIGGMAKWKGVSVPGLPPAAALAIAAGSLLLLLALGGNRRFPATLVIVGAGLTLGFFVAGPSVIRHLQIFTLSLPSLPLPGRATFTAAFLLLVIPQLPVTFGNAVIATADVSRSYFHQRSRRVTPRALCASLGIANTAIGLLGGMPVCHGSGGMTAHYRLGARTGGATVMIGALLVASAMLFGNSAVYLILMLPLPVLGALLFYVGVEHARLVLSLNSRFAILVAVSIGVVSLIWANVALGMAVGMGVSFLAGTAKLTRRLLSAPG